MLILKEDIDNAKLSNSAIFFKNCLDIKINWDFIIDEINTSFKREHKKDLENMYLWNWRTHNSISVERMFYIQLVSEFPTNIPEINNFAADFGKALFNIKDYQYPNKTIQYFINIVPSNDEIGVLPNSPKHNDDWDVVFIQVVGESTWNIYSNKDDELPTQSEKIVPGDAIFIPKGVYHEVYALTPRAGVSLAYNDVPGSERNSGASKYGFNALTPEIFMRIKNAQI